MNQTIFDSINYNGTLLSDNPYSTFSRKTPYLPPGMKNIEPEPLKGVMRWSSKSSPKGLGQTVQGLKLKRDFDHENEPAPYIFINPKPPKKATAEIFHTNTFLELLEDTFPDGKRKFQPTYHHNEQDRRREILIQFKLETERAVYLAEQGLLKEAKITEENAYNDVMVQDPALYTVLTNPNPSRLHEPLPPTVVPPLEDIPSMPPLEDIPVKMEEKEEEKSQSPRFVPVVKGESFEETLLNVGLDKYVSRFLDEIYNENKTLPKKTEDRTRLLSNLSKNVSDLLEVRPYTNKEIAEASTLKTDSKGKSRRPLFDTRNFILNLVRLRK